MARVYVGQKDNARAEENFKKAVEIDPKNVNAKLALADFYSSTGQQEKNVPIYRGLAEDGSIEPAVKRALANVYLTKRSWDQAINIADDLLKADPKDAQARILRGQALLAQGKNAEAARRCRRP